MIHSYLAWHDYHLLAQIYGAGFHFSLNDQLTRILEPIQNGDTERSFGVSLRKRQLIQKLQKGWTAEPRRKVSLQRKRVGHNLPPFPPMIQSKT